MRPVAASLWPGRLLGGSAPWRGARDRWRSTGTVSPAYAGLEDGVDYHWWDLAKAAALSTLLGFGAELATDDNDRLIRAIRDGAQDTINQAGQQIIQRQLQVAPTLTIRPGFPVRVIVTRDLIFENTGG